MNKTPRQAPLTSASVFQNPTALQRLMRLIEVICERLRRSMKVVQLVLKRLLQRLVKMAARSEMLLNLSYCNLDLLHARAKADASRVRVLSTSALHFEASRSMRRMMGSRRCLVDEWATETAG